MNVSCSKVFVLGLDGGSWNLLKVLVNQGYMPNLQNVYEQGVSGTLYSTTPPYTAPAWVSCVTGMNPGGHGIFGFTKGGNVGSRGILISSQDVKVPRVWHFLNSAGKTVGLINIPVTYPAEEVDGFIIPGFLTPAGKKDFTYPVSLYEELVKEIDTYIINVKIATRKINTEEEFTRFLDDILFSTKKRFEAMKILYTKYSPDFFMTVFTCLDKIQHKFWKFMDMASPLYHTPVAERARPKLFEVYQLVDDIVGYVLKTIDKNTSLYIVSDHGFGPFEKRVFINKWLAQQGLLYFNKGKIYLNKLLYRTGLKKVTFSNRSIGISDNPVDRCIDYAKSLFFSSDVYEQGVYFNEGAENVQHGRVSYEEERSTLREKMLTLKDPSDGKAFVDEVRFREEVYWGPYVNQAPDILLRMKNYGYLLNKSIPLKGNSFVETVRGPEGCHRSDGIFAACGKCIEQNKKLDASIVDIAPTILYNLNTPVPKDMDGKVLKGIFTSEFQGTTELRYTEEGLSAHVTDTKETDYSKREEDEIRGRLKDLGYLD